MMENITAYDVETSTFAKGNPFSINNKMVYAGFYNKAVNLLPFEYKDYKYGQSILQSQTIIDETEILVGFNLKFDLHWGNKYNLDFSKCRIWDGQLVHFMLQGQTTSYPSLNSVAEYYGLGQKEDEVSKYWEAGIDTEDIPKEILEKYLEKDLILTKQIYYLQKEDVKKKSIQFQRLVSLANQDLLVLQNIERNGLYFNEEMCLQEATTLKKQINDLRMELHDYHNIEEFNTESGDHLSCLIYGGTITIPRREIIGTYKTGDKAGTDKYGWKDYTYTLPRLFNPLPKSELKKPGYFATGEDILRQLKSRDKFAKRVIEIILQLAKLEKIVGTYYNGLPKLRETMNWTPNYLHGNLNQVTARTGRLSSTKPNLQNISGDMKKVFETRYK